jgi:predicted metal-binding membrane protein
MHTTSSSRLRREQVVILTALFLLAAGAWVLLTVQAKMVDMRGLTMGMGAPLFLGVWIAMMVAMMFPSAAPMILMFARVGSARRVSRRSFVPTWVFVGAYLVVWTVFGAAAYVAAMLAQAAAESSPWLMANAARFGGATLLLAGAYQLSPLKRACLTVCRSPLSFVMQSWRDGYVGALRMGIEHGASCLGCCWMLFVILFPLGIMNLAAMALLTLLIFAEKIWPVGVRVSQVAAVLLMGYGLFVIVVPAALPIML